MNNNIIRYLDVLLIDFIRKILIKEKVPKSYWL
jgi:hypothetical protein